MVVKENLWIGRAISSELASPQRGDKRAALLCVVLVAQFLWGTMMLCASANLRVLGIAARKLKHCLAIHSKAYSSDVFVLVFLFLRYC